MERESFNNYGNKKIGTLTDLLALWRRFQSSILRLLVISVSINPSFRNLSCKPPGSSCFPHYPWPSECLFHPPGSHQFNIRLGSSALWHSLYPTCNYLFSELFTTFSFRFVLSCLTGFHEDVIKFNSSRLSQNIQRSSHTRTLSY